MCVMSPTKPREAAMKPADFTALLERTGIGQSEAARLLGVGRTTVIRWLKGDTPISEANALLIRKRIK